MLEVVKILTECEKCCPEATPILIQEEEGDSFDTYLTQNTTIERQVSHETQFDSIGTTLQPVERRSLSPNGVKPKRTHSRSKSAETNKLLAELERDQMVRSTSVQSNINRNLITSDYSSSFNPRLDYAPGGMRSMSEMNRGMSYNSEVFGDANDSGIFPGFRHSFPVTPG